MAKTVLNDLLHIFRSSVSAVLPEKLIRNTIRYNPTNEQLTIADEKYNLENRDVYLVGTGKAVQNMAREVEKMLGNKIKEGIISIPVGSLTGDNFNDKVVYYEGATNNLPDVKAELTAMKVKNLITNLNHTDILIVLISGGGSSLLPLSKEPISLEDKTQLIKNLANSGADIIELNTVRKRISDLKGGQLALKAHPALVISLILSDIVGDPLDLIASGPTVENKDETNAALSIIEKYNLYDQLPVSIKTTLEELEMPKEFSKDNKVRNHIIGSNKISIREAETAANSLNYLSIALSNTITGNVNHIANEYVKLTSAVCNFIEGSLDRESFEVKISTLDIPGIKISKFFEQISEVDARNKDICLILAGELTVEVKGTGKGGRNQQLALEFSNIIHNVRENFKNFDVYLLSAGTDGIDGPTDAAGAIGYLNLISDSEKENIDVKKYLDNNDSYNFYRSFKEGKLHVLIGHTNTNVMDIHLIVLKRNSS